MEHRSTSRRVSFSLVFRMVCLLFVGWSIGSLALERYGLVKK
jgi:hypothetical protein